VPWQTPTPVGIPKTGFPTERMPHVAARNIAAQIRGEAPTHQHAFADMPAVCVMGAGSNGVIILADKMPPRWHGLHGLHSHAYGLPGRWPLAVRHCSIRKTGYLSAILPRSSSDAFGETPKNSRASNSGDFE
jgi:hypothetical protein